MSTEEPSTGSSARKHKRKQGKLENKCGPGTGFCIKCKKPRCMHARKVYLVTFKYKKSGKETPRSRMRGKCETCGNELSRIVKTDEKEGSGCC